MSNRISLRQFHQKRYKIAHPRARTKLQQDMIRCFARDLTATQTASLIKRDLRTINPYFQWLRQIVAKHYQEFLRFREHDMDYDLMLFLSHTAMISMYWLDTDHSHVWDRHTVLLRGDEVMQQQSNAELMRYTLADETRRADYLRHTEQNYHWLSDQFMQRRMHKLRTPMLNHQEHASETLYRLMITLHVLLHEGLAGEISDDIKGRFIGEDGDLEKAGVVYMDELFDKHIIHAHAELKANIIFSDLISQGIIAIF